MERRKRPARSRLLLLAVAVLVLGIIILRMTGVFPRMADVENTPTPTIETTEAATFSSEEQFEDLGSRTPITEEAGPITETPADQWANAVLAQALPMLRNAPPPQGMPWWNRETPIGTLSWSADTVAIDEIVVEVPSGGALEIAVLRANPLVSVEVLADASPDAGALLLTQGAGGQSWLLSNGSPLVALKALVVQAERREIELRAAYLREPRSAVQIVLLEARSTDVNFTPTAAPNVTQAGITPTATRAFEVYLGRLVTQYLDPAIVTAEGLEASITQEFVQRHPWTGILAAGETNIRIGGRVIPIEHATELSFYVLQGEPDAGSISRVFSVRYDAASQTTQFVEAQATFQTHRMKEVVYWAATRAVEADGQLLVAFDDYGTSQAITLIGFRPFQR